MLTSTRDTTKAWALLAFLPVVVVELEPDAEEEVAEELEDDAEEAEEEAELIEEEVVVGLVSIEGGSFPNSGSWTILRGLLTL